jgi:hypothetical protein
MIEWEPIETAPRDGTPLLLWLPAPLSKPAIGHWNQTLFCWVVEDSNLEGCDEHQPSHWASVTPRAVPRSCLPEGLSARPRGEQPSWAER